MFVILIAWPLRTIGVWENFLDFLVDGSLIGQTFAFFAKYLQKADGILIYKFES